MKIITARKNGGEIVRGYMVLPDKVVCSAKAYYFDGSDTQFTKIYCNNGIGEVIVDMSLEQFLAEYKHEAFNNCMTN